MYNKFIQSTESSSRTFKARSHLPGYMSNFSRNSKEDISNSKESGKSELETTPTLHNKEEHVHKRIHSGKTLFKTSSSTLFNE